MDRLCLAVFLASLEVSIVATSLVAITDGLKGFGQSSWIISVYMLIYTGRLISIDPRAGERFAYCMLRLLDRLGQAQRHFWAEVITYMLPWAIHCRFWSMWSCKNNVATVRGLRFVCIQVFSMARNMSGSFFEHLKV